MPGLDSFDRKILAMLDCNARTTVSDIAKAVRLSKSAAAQRIRRLEEEKYLLGYYAVIDSSKLGYLSFRVYLKFYGTTPKREARMMDFLMKEPCVWWLGKISVNWNLGFVVWAKDLGDFGRFWKRFLARFRRDVGAHEICPYLKLRHFSNAFLSESMHLERDAGIVGEGTKVGLDSRDRRLLSVLAVNGRENILSLSQKTGLTPMMVKYRLGRLTKNGVIVGFRARINLAKLGYSLYKIDFCLDDLSKFGEMMAFAVQQPNLSYIDETVGTKDLEADFYFRSEQEMEAFVGRFKTRFPGQVREVSYLVYSDVVKYTYFPEN